MKLKVILLSLFVVVSLVPKLAVAADPLEVAPDMYKLLYENERVRVMEVTFKPGDKIAEHSHPDHFVTVLDAGKLKVMKKDGSANELDLKQKEVVWIPAEAHSAQNTGTSTVRLLVTELKTGTPASMVK